MQGAIFVTSRYGSTLQYAEWIAEATGLPVFNIRDKAPDPSDFDFVVIGSPVLYYKLLIRGWVKRNLSTLLKRPTILFTVSGAPAGPKLDGWIAASLPENVVSGMKHVALRGRQNPKELNPFDRIMLIIAGLKNPDPIARKDEMRGFDYMDKSSIGPVVALIEDLQTKGAT